jgi:hypothetical protein
VKSFLFPRGAGASEGPVPPGYTEVPRWADLPEVSAWMRDDGTRIPPGIGGLSQRVYVTLPGAPQPPGTGPCRIEFSFPAAGLMVAGHVLWRQIMQPVQSRPIYNVRIFVPDELRRQV